MTERRVRLEYALPAGNTCFPEVCGACARRRRRCAGCVDHERLTGANPGLYCAPFQVKDDFATPS